MSNRKPYHCFGCGTKCTGEYKTPGGNPVCQRCGKAYQVAVEFKSHAEARRVNKLLAARGIDGNTI